MRKRLLLMVAVVAAAVVVHFLNRPAPAPVRHNELSTPVPQESYHVPGNPDAARPDARVKPPNEQGATVVPPASTPSPASPPVRNNAPVAMDPVEEVTEPADELENVQFMVRGYRDALGENPVGNNREITKALIGDNAKQVKQPMPTGSRLNGEGELTDRWG
ncbi:MAG: hypothetical protein EOP84_18975, partial [Verrucomicrobiaceae bacterium]